MEHPKNHKSNGGEEEEDRLSRLPNDVIHRIFYFLHDTRTAARTAVLSKRWRNLWTLLPDLSFRYSSDNFLPYALLRRDQHCPVCSFYLFTYPESGDYALDLRDWAVAYAVRHGVCHLDLRHPHDGIRSIVPPALLTCQTLKTLTLAAVDVSELSSACFHTVTTLRLEWCGFHRGFFDVSAIFPNLADLRLDKVDFDGGSQGLGKGGVMEVSGTKLVYFSMRKVCCDRVKLCAPNLVDFSWSIDASGVVSDFFEIDIPSLQRAQLLAYLPDDGDKLLKLLNGVGNANAESLTINARPIEVLVTARLFMNQTSPFRKLKSLKLILESEGNRERFEKIKQYFLMGTPHPQSVEIVSLGSEKDGDGTLWKH
ncbi:hypothetical protein Tsubulata_039298 [Turnera subulata]|uniref:F-box domain-containing protein n=1 Tax=Turnera subulata TaxID=218843 RepID=A0A9Q0FVN5_9ROSI|nr:hypothetical protein Tsubulata_039298 [Turnera subulata]